MELNKVKIYYDTRGKTCTPVIEIQDYKFTGTPTDVDTAIRLCTDLINPSLEVSENLGKFEFEPIEP